MTRSGLRLAASDYEVQYRTVHGYRRAFVHVGSGPALLLLHGIGHDLDTWREIIADLAKDHTVIAPDLLGHGRSDKPRADYSVAAYANGMRDLLSVLDVDRVTVIGHSLGGGVATQFAYQYPERCERLVLVSTGGVARAVTPALRALTAPGAHLAMAVLNLPLVEPAVRGFFSALALADSNIAIDREIMMQMFDAMGNHTARLAFVRTLRAVVDVHGQVVTMLDRCYLTVGMPTLLVWGDRDGVIPLEHGHIAHAAMPGSRLEVFEGVGHFPHMQDPDRFLRVLRDFLSTTIATDYSVEQWRRLLRTGRPGVATALPPGASSPFERAGRVARAALSSVRPAASSAGGRVD